VLFESGLPGGAISGLTTNYARVEVFGDPELTNTIHAVRISAADEERCYGEFYNSGEQSLELPTNYNTQLLDVPPVMEFQ
jgi:hypothetical protein